MPAEPLAPLTAEEIDALAIKIITNVTYFASTAEDASHAFMILLAFVTEDQIPSNAITMYEDWSNAGPRSINGLPMFTSGKFFPKESWDDLKDALDRKADALGISKGDDDAQHGAI